MNVFGASWGASWGSADTPVVTPGDCVLSPMAIAMQGIGFGQHLAAVQGLWCVLDLIDEEDRLPRVGGGKLSDLVLREDKAAQRFLDRIRGLEDAERIRQTWDEIDALRDRDAEAEADDQGDDVDQAADSGAAGPPSAPAPRAPAESASVTSAAAAGQALQIAGVAVMAEAVAAQDFTDEDMDAALVALCLLAFDD